VSRRATAAPAISAVNPYVTRLTTAGDLGTVVTTCTDGRRVSAGFVAETRSSGVASGWDQHWAAR
jgi:hypothetical protein